MSDTTPRTDPAAEALDRAGWGPPDGCDPIQVGFWVPSHEWATEKYLVPLNQELAKRHREGTLSPMTDAVAELKDWVTRSGIYRMWLTSMIQQANDYVISIWDTEAWGEIVGDGDTIWLFGYDNFFYTLNEIISTSPGFNQSVMVGTPMNGLMAVSMATEAGLALFHDATFNAQFKKMLDAWNAFLKTSASLDKLDIADPEKAGSWISKQAFAAGVWDQMEYDASQPGYGFACWNDFFIRNFVPGARPFHGTSADICIGCETTPWQYADNLAAKTEFWIKDVNYSLLDLFGGRADLAAPFVGGQLYQGFLSATHYHKWQCPLDGVLIRSWVEPGTYFAQRPGQGEGPGTWEGTESQPYLGHVATRAIFIFEHPQCGQVALICIGMVEVSTCVINDHYLVGEGEPAVFVKKGDPIGNFEFGGSTHAMIFQPGKVDLAQWAVDAVSHRNDKTPTALGTVIATPTGG